MESFGDHGRRTGHETTTARVRRCRQAIGRADAIKVAGREFNRRCAGRSKGGNGSSTVVLINRPSTRPTAGRWKDAGCPHVISTSAIVAESMRRGLCDESIVLRDLKTSHAPVPALFQN